MSTEENKRTVRRYFEEFHSNRQLSIASEIFAAPMDDGPVELARMLAEAFPDYRIEVLEQVAEGNKVATVWRASGTHQGTWMSPLGAIAGSGRPVSWTGTTTLKMEDGKICDVLGTNWDHLGILQQIGTIEPVAPRPGA